MARTEQAAAPRISVVIPTYQRRALVLLTVQSLGALRDAPPFEVVVVVDGSTDGTAPALRSLDTAFPLTVVEQPNRGAASARNAGAGRARGELLLFLDDDMEADPFLLAEHERSHRSGADVVIGHMPLHPDSPDTVISRAVGAWARSRRDRLTRSGSEIGVHDLLTGQISVSAAAFKAVGGFDASFTRDGTFGGEDLDFGLRLIKAGHSVVFNPRAISRQRYVVGARRHLQQCRESGRSDVALIAKHPEHEAELLASSHASSSMSRRLWRPLVATPVLGPLIAGALQMVATLLVEHQAPPRLSQAVFSRARVVAYLQGARSAGGFARNPALVALAYHGIRERAGDPIATRYSVAPEELRAQLTALRDLGYRFVDLDTVIDVVAGRRPYSGLGALLTFDDAYESILSALPVLEEFGAPAVVFAVSGRLGGINDWDEHLGVEQQRLLDAGALRDLSRRGVAIGAHSRTHPELPSLPDAAVDDEIRGSREDLVAAGLPSPRGFAYPYGERSPSVVEATRAAGFGVAFTVEPGLIRPGAERFALPRIEVFRGDSSPRLRAKLALAAAPERVRRRLWRFT